MRRGSCRRWSHLPVGSQFVSAGLAYTTGDLGFDPVLRIEEATVGMSTGAIGYQRAFGLLCRSERVDVLVPFQHARWEGILDGEPASRERSLVALSLGYGLGQRSRFGVTLGLGRTLVDTGLDSQTVGISYLLSL